MIFSVKRDIFRKINSAAAQNGICAAAEFAVSAHDDFSSSSRQLASSGGSRFSSLCRICSGEARFSSGSHERGYAPSVMRRIRSYCSSANPYSTRTCSSASGVVVNTVYCAVMPFSGRLMIFLPPFFRARISPSPRWIVAYAPVRSARKIIRVEARDDTSWWCCSASARSSLRTAWSSS